MTLTYQDATGTHEMTPEMVAEHLGTFEQRKAAKRQAANDRADEAFAAGYTPESGTLAGHTLQVRNSEDRTNWLTSQATYGAAIANGQGAVEGALFRTAANVNITTTYAECYQVIVVGMAQWGRDIYQNLWALKDAIDAAEDQAALDAVDLDEGWPE